ncbi:putative recombination endonuclease VII protein [Rhizobium phage RHph_I1_18]|nr:putative recombination endonuclease VII protein [Rhizobium phage RHph_I1_18]
MKKSEERERARLNGEKTYQGRVCLKCGGTTRYVSGCGCVACQNQRVKDHGKAASYRYNKTDKGKATQARHMETDKFLETKRVRNQRRYKEDSAKFRNWDLRSKYGITLDQYNEMFEKQNGCCYICNKHDDEQYYRLSVDHNHDTGKVRKLLCSACNKSLGLLKEDVSTLERMINYINEHK